MVWHVAAVRASGAAMGTRLCAVGRVSSACFGLLWLHGWDAELLQGNDDDARSFVSSARRLALRESSC